MDDKQILRQISELVDEEHERLAQLEAALDQCWDLLRRRRAAREFGTDPGTAQARPVNEVEGYLQ